MMQVDEIQKALQDRRIGMVAQATGVHPNTIRDIRDSDSPNPTYRVIKALSEYLEARNGK